MKKEKLSLKIVVMLIIFLIICVIGCLNNISQSSSSTSLKSLSIEPEATLEQDSENSTIYRTTVSNDINSIKVNAIPNNSNAKITIKGNNELEVGTNKITVNVTSQNGESTDYIIYVRRLSTSIAEEKITPNVQENSAKEVQNTQNNINPNQEKNDSNNEIKIESYNEINNENENTDSEELKNEQNNENLNNIENEENKPKNINFFKVTAIIFVLIIIVFILIVLKKNKGKHYKNKK